MQDTLSLTKYMVISYPRVFVLGFLAVFFASFSNMARVEASPTPSHTHRVEAKVRRLSVIDYFNMLPYLGIGYPATRQAKRELLQAENHPVIDVRHDYLLVHPDSSPAEQIAIFRACDKPDLLAVSMPDFQCDYNSFALFRLQNGRLREVTRQTMPIPPRTERFLYELPRFGTTIGVFEFDIEKETRRHVFDLRWHGGHFVKARCRNQNDHTLCAASGQEIPAGSGNKRTVGIKRR